MANADVAIPARDRVLDAAEDLFAKKGFGPSTIKEIGKAAGLNPALLYYYFRDKDALYRAVLQRVVAAMIARGGAAIDTASEPRDAIRALVRAQVEFLLTHPNAPRLFVREMIDHEARNAEAIILEIAAALFDRLCGLIEQGQRDGYFRADLDPRFSAVSTIAQVVYFMIARPAVGLFLAEARDQGGVTEEIARAFGRHAGEFAVAAMSTPETRV